MGYTPPKKKKNLWDQITEGIGTAVRNVQKGADAVIPGDQSSWYKEPAPERQVQRPTQIRIEQPKPQVIASFRNEQPESIASFEKDQTQGLQFDTKDNNSLKLQNALNGGNLQVKQPEVNTQRLTVASAPAKVPNITVPQSAPQPKQKYIGYDMSEKENKKLFGVDVGQYMGDFGQVRKMNVGREAEATKQNLVSTYSGMSNEAKRIYREKVQSMADQGNPAAINTMNALKENNVISGDWSQKLDDATETVFGKGGKAIVSGMQQGVSNVADVSIMGGAVLNDTALGLQGASDEQRARELQEYEKMRNWFKTNKAVNGEFLNNKPDYAPTGDFTRDALDLGGRGLQTGLDATMFLNPASNLLKTPGSVTGRQILGNAGRQAAMYGTLDATATGAQVYGQTGDVGQAVKSGVTAGLVSGVTQGGLETATGFMGRGGAPQVARGAGSIVDDVVKESSPQVLKSVFGLSDNVATKLAQETDEAVVEQTLRQLAVDPTLNISPEMRKRLQDEGITEVNVGNSAYGAEYDRNGRITVTGQDTLDDNLSHEIGHAIWQKRLTPDERQAFAGVNGRASQEARNRAGYSADDIASEDFSDFTRLALSGRIAEVPDSVRGIVAKYAGVMDTALKQGEVPNTKITVHSSGQNGATGFATPDKEFSAQFNDSPTSKMYTREIDITDYLDTRNPAQRAQLESVLGKQRVDEMINRSNNGLPNHAEYGEQEALQAAANRLGYKGIALSETDKMTQFNGRDVIAYADAEVPQTRPANNMNLGTDARARFGTNTVDPAKEISAKYGGKVEDVARNIERYGEDATRIMYARKSDSLPYDPETNTGIKSIDAVVTAELRKQFGGKARVTGAPKPTESVSVEPKQPQVGKTLKDDELYSTANSYVSFGSDSTGGVISYNPKGTGSVPERISYNKLSQKTRDELVSAELEYKNARANSTSPVAPGTVTETQIARGRLELAQSNAIEELGLQEHASIQGARLADGTRPTVQKPFLDRYTDWLESKWKSKEYSDAQIQDMEANPNKYKAQFESETSANSPEASTTATVTGVPTIDTPQGRVNTESGEILDEFTANLNDAVARAGKEIESINAEVRSLGFDPNDIRRKMTAANRGEYQMTPDEMNAASLYTNRLDQARGSLEEAGVQIEGQQQFYTPQVKGESFLPSSREELSDFGYKERRTNAYELDEINYGDNPQIDYIVKAENRDLLVQKATNDAAIIDGRSVSPDGVRQAAADTLELQKKIKDKSNSEGVLTNDTLADLYTIGKNEGYTQVDNNYNPGMIVQEPKAMLEQAGIYKNGFEQFDNSVGYANEFVDVLKQNNVPPNQVAAALEQSIRGRMPDADQSSVSAAVEYAMKAMSRNGVEAVNAANIFERAFKNVAKSELFRVGKTTRFSSTKMNKVVNEQINGRILTDAYQKNAAQQFDRFLSERINASLRGLNIVSALFELGDVANIFAKFGVKDMKNAKFGFGKVDGERFALTKKYGQTNSHFASNDIPDVSKLDRIWANENTNLAKKVYDSYRAVENKFLFFRYIEEIKTEMYFRSAENFYKSPQGGGLQGGALVDRVMEDFHKTMLPHKLATANRIVGKMPSTITQYLNWSLQATKRMGRTISGSDTGGKFANMTRGERVARGIGAEIVPKVAVATLAGVPIMQVLGMRDFTNATSGDFTGIEDEDKNVMDTVVQTLSISPAVGVAGNFYFANRRNQIADERAANGESYGSERRVEDQPLNVAAESAKMLIPFHTQAKKSSQVLEAHNKGYYENRDGRIQAEGPNGAELAMGLVTGKGYTPTMREYQDAPDVVSVIKGKANVGDLITKNQSVANVVQALGGDSTREYNRPLTDDYSDKFKAIEGEARTELLKGGRQYNSYLDNLKRTNEDAYNNYISSMDGNHVNPEYWREITKDPETFQMVKDRKLQLYKDLGTEYDPIYDLPDDQASVVLKYKSAPTGDDMALRNILNKEQWYKDYKDRVTAFYDKKGEQTESDFDSTARVKEWEALDDKLSSFYYDKEAKEAPAWAKDFPLVFQQKAINDKFGFDSPESKTFFKGNADAYQAQKEGYDKAQLEVINAMRVIEGVPPMSWEAYQQATEIADTDTSDDKDWKKYGKGGNGGGNGVDAGGATFGQKRGTGLDKVTVKVPKIAVKRKGGVPGKVTVKKGGKLL